LVEAYTPLEVGLDNYISDSKGCYTGQEIIARQVTYGKVTKHLVGLALSDVIEPGGNLEMDGKSIGTLTSIAQSPRFGVIGLGVVRRPHHEVRTELRASSGGKRQFRLLYAPCHLNKLGEIGSAPSGHTDGAFYVDKDFLSLSKNIDIVLDKFK
jgi:folate-binding protein YgfZ